MLNLIAQTTTTIDFAGGAEAANLPGASTDFAGWLARILGFALVIAALLVFMYLIWAGIDWISAGGDSGKVQKARERITGAIIGIIVLASSVGIFMLVQQFLGIKVLEFESESRSNNNTSRSLPRRDSSAPGSNLPRNLTPGE